MMAKSLNIPPSMLLYVFQVYDSTWLQQPQDLEEWEARNIPSEAAAELAASNAPTTRELTIKQFLALHLRLRGAHGAQTGLLSAGGRPKSAGSGVPAEFNR
jgi:hypothetical protein